MTTQLTTDYLIIGSGAVGMAFADVILNETDASVLLVDKHHKPGGHWNDAYSFVTLHQPSAYYGVSSRELSRGFKDQVGLNKGLHELASGAQVLDYFDDVMRNQFLPSGRVQYFPMCEYQADGRFTSMLSDNAYQVTVGKKIIDATYYKTSVPSTHTPKYAVDDQVELRPLNDLPQLTSAREGYVVVGGGKTAIDACLWLLQNQIKPDDIRWIMPRDSWFVDRKNTQPTLEFFNNSMGTQAAQLEVLAKAESIDDLFDRLEKAGVLLRLDKNVEPRMFHGATISEAEITELRRIKNVIRMGHVTHIKADEILLEQGAIATSPQVLHIDCTARAVGATEVLPMFHDNTITLQCVRSYQPIFSAAFVAHIEASYDDEQKKQQLCSVVPLPDHHTDWLRITAAQMMNQYLWSQEPGLRDWLAANRLDGFTSLTMQRDNLKPDQLEILAKMKEYAMPAMANLQQFVAQLDAAEQAA